MINALAYGRATGCGAFGSCQGQLVVEADGSVYPCDFYCLDQWKIGNLAQQSWQELMRSPVWTAFMHRAHKQPELCDRCPMTRFCGGHCKRLQPYMCCSPEDAICGHQQFLLDNKVALRTIALDCRRSA